MRATPTTANKQSIHRPIRRVMTFLIRLSSDTLLRTARHGRLRSTQRQFLHPHVSQLADEEAVLAAAVDGVDRAELLRPLAHFAELADDRAVEPQLVDLAAVVEILRRI